MPSATSGKTSDRSSDPEVLPGKIVQLASIASTPFSVSYHSLKGTNILTITQSRTLSPSLRILSAFLKSSTIVHLQHHPSIQATVPFPQVQYLSIILRLATTSPPPHSPPLLKALSWFLTPTEIKTNLPTIAKEALQNLRPAAFFSFICYISPLRHNQNALSGPVL